MHPGIWALTCTPPSSPSLSVCPSLPCPHPLHPTHPQLAQLGSGAPPASTHAAATTGRAVAPRMGPATAPPAGPDSSARSVSPASQPPSYLESHAAACWLPWASSGPAVEGGWRQVPGRGANHPAPPTPGIEEPGWIQGVDRPNVLEDQGYKVPQQSALLGQEAQSREEQPGGCSKEIPAGSLIPRHLGPKDSPPLWREGSQHGEARCRVSLVLTPCSETARSCTNYTSTVASTLFLQAAQQHFMGRTVGVCASVRMAPAVTTSAASAPAAQASRGDTVSRVSCPDPSPWVSMPGLPL